MWARSPRGCICTNTLRVEAEFIKQMLMIPFIVQNLDAIGQTVGSIDRLVISSLLASVRAIGKRELNPWMSSIERTDGDRPNLTCSESFPGVNPGIHCEYGSVSQSSAIRIQVKLNRIYISVAPWLPPSLWARGIFMYFPPPQSAYPGPTPSFATSLYLPHSTSRKPQQSGDRPSQRRFFRSSFANFP